MKILMLSADFLPNVGGITSHIVYLAKALAARGHTVIVLKPSEKDTAWFSHPYGFTVHHLKKKYNLWAERLHIWQQLRTMHKQGLYDILHWHQLMGYETKFLPSIPKIFTNHTSMYLEQYRTWRGRQQLRLMLRHANSIISPSIELYEKSTMIKSSTTNYYIPNGVDEAMFSAASIVDSEFPYQEIMQRKQAQQKIILCPRRLEPKCGVEYFIKAIPHIVAQFAEAHFVIAGHGGFLEEERKLRQWLIDREYLQNVSFLGDVKNEHMPSLYLISDVVVFPSLMEATSIACLEAMACQRAVVGTNVGGLNQLISHEKTGLLINACDSHDLAEKVCYLLHNQDVRDNFGKEARIMIEKHFTWTDIAKQTETVYCHVMERYT